MIILDLSLRSTDGREFLDHIKRDDYLKRIPVIVWTASSNPADVESCYRRGANSFVRKTFDFAEADQSFERLARFWLQTVTLPQPLA